MSDDGLPGDPFRPTGRGLWDDLVEAGRLWRMMDELEPAELLTALFALTLDDCRALILERIYRDRFKVRIEADDEDERRGADG